MGRPECNGLAFTVRALDAPRHISDNSQNLGLKKGDPGWQFFKARKRAREWKNYSFQEADKLSGIPSLLWPL